MPSLVTSIIGGFQGASASHNAAKYLQEGYEQAGQTVNDAVAQVNPEILATAAQAGKDVTGAAQTAGAGATSSAADFLKLLAPYLSGGSTAMESLMAGIGSDGAFAKPFTADMMSKYSPAYQFQLAQGQKQANASMAAAGLTGSGGAMKSLQRYTQDYAGTAFKNANDIYQQQNAQRFNQLATLANMGQTAATTGGEAGLQAAEYAGNLNTNAAQWAGGADINARNLASSNTLSGANFLANTQIGARQAQAQGDLGAAASWNEMLGGIGAAGNTLLLGGLDPTGGGGWSFKNLGKNLWGTAAKTAPKAPTAGTDINW